MISQTGPESACCDKKAESKVKAGTGPHERTLKVHCDSMMCKTAFASPSLHDIGATKRHHCAVALASNSSPTS